MRLVVLFSAMAALAADADWTRFRGPNGAGVADSAALPSEFSPTKNVAWKTPLPPGHSSPVVSGDRVFVTGEEGGKLLTIALDRASGKIAWRRESPRDRAEPVDKRNNAASPTPAVDNGALYVFFQDYGLMSYGVDGNERWRTPLGPFINVYGMGASPIVAGGVVALVCDQSIGSFIAGFDKNTGKERWRAARPEALSGHSTPVLYESSDGLQILAPSSFRLDAYAAATGRLEWFVRGLPAEMKSTPVLADGTIYINGFNSPENDPGKQIKIPEFADVLAQYDRDRNGTLAKDEIGDERTKLYFPFIDLNRDSHLDAAEWKTYQLTMTAENSLLALRAGGHGDVTTTAIKWKFQRSIPQLPSVVLYRDVLYMINDGGVLSTFDPATGKVLKQARLRGAADQYYASPVAGDGKIYIASRSGVVTVLKAGGEQEVAAVNELDDEIYATPALVDGRIFLRTRGALYCFAEPPRPRD